MQSFRLLRQHCTTTTAVRCGGFGTAPLPQVPPPGDTTRTRKASNYRRPQLTAQRDQLQALKTSLFHERTELTPAEWEETRSSLMASYKHMNEHNIDAVILGVCSEAHHLPLAKDYVRHLRASGLQPNAATLGRLLRVYNATYHARGGGGGSSPVLSDAEQQEILDIAALLRGKHAMLDATTCENLIHGLVATDQWRQAHELLEMIKLTATPTVAAYTELTAKAFSADALPLGWQLLEDMVALRKPPKCEVFVALLHAIERNPSESHQNFENFFVFLAEHDLMLTEKVAQCLQEVAERLPTALSVSSASLNRIGKCGHCGQFMAHVSISDAEFRELSDSFLNKVLIRDDVFQKSTPEEVGRFRRFVAQSAPYDCVIDGLNVAYSMGAKNPPHVLANLLASVVRYFHARNKHVLVLGRRHMNSWPKDAMQFVRKNASLFLTNNLTHDDPFLLYATLKSGQMTDFFSRDLMRSHAYLLGPKLKSIFRRWQQEHQYSLITQTEDGKIIVKEPIRHLICAHKVQNIWHIPCRQVYSVNPSDTFEVAEKWLCVRTQK